MKKKFSTALLLLLAVAATTSVFAQKQKSKDELLKDIVTLSNSQKPEDKDASYVLSKEFISRFPKDKAADKIKTFVKNYREQYLFLNAFDKKDLTNVFAIGKEILTEESENVGVMMHLAYSGYVAVTSGQKTFGEDGLKYSRLALQTMDKGIFPASFAPFNTKEDALAWMNYIAGSLVFETDAKAGAVSMFKALQYESMLKKTPEPYITIAQFYERKADAMTKELNAKSKSISDTEFKAEKVKLDAVNDQLLDVYARAFKIAESSGHPAKDELKNQLKTLYKYQKKTDAGFESFVTYIVTTEFKDPAGF